jgi:hypothetical protein
LEVGGLQLSTPNPGYGTQGFQISSFQFAPTGLSPSLAGRFRPLWLGWLGVNWTRNTTSPSGFPKGFGLDCSLFAHVTKGIPCWFLFLPLLRYFRSESSRSFVERSEVPKESTARSLIWVSSDLSLLAATRGVSPLVAPFFSAQAWSSTKRRCMSGLIGLHSNVCLASETHVFTYLACVRLSLRADKSSLHPLLLTESRAACFCGDLFDQLDRQISTE